MLTLIFNTTEKTVEIITENQERKYFWDKVPTVKPIESYYEIMQKDENDRALPVARIPVSTTIMLIKK